MGDWRDQIGRSIVVGIRGADESSPELRVDLEVCAEAGVGGVVLFDRDLPTGGARNIVSAAQVRELTALLRERLGDGLLVMIDQEGGPVARLNAAMGFDGGVSASEFAAMDDSSRRSIAAAQADQLADLGINVNLAPVVDLALIGGSVVTPRCFGADPDIVDACARIWVAAHRAAGVATCLKHFPGHGSAPGDTHEGLVNITGRTSRDAELAPYARLANEPGVLVMTGHLIERQVDDRLPASLSAAHTSGVLRDQIGFRGLAVTDSIDMGAIASRWSPGEASAMAIAACADIVMDGVNAPGPARACPALEMVRGIAQAIERGDIADAQARLSRTAQRLGSLRSALGWG